MIRDNHPLLFALGDDGLNIGNSYFPGTEDSYDTENTYTLAPQNEDSGDTDSDKSENRRSTTPKITHTHNHNWAHDFDEMTTVLINAGLRIEKIGEYDISTGNHHRCSNSMNKQVVAHAARLSAHSADLLDCGEKSRKLTQSDCSN